MLNKSNLISVFHIQYTSQNDEWITLEIIKTLIRQAIGLGLDIITLPECAMSRYVSLEITGKLAKKEKR